MRIVKDEGAERAPRPQTEPMAGVDEPSRRSSVNVDSEPIRQVARVDVAAVDAGPPALEHRFELEAHLGRGGMGTVARARDRRLLRDVAVKIIHGHLDWGPHQARFAREAQVTAQLQHPNIVPVYSLERSHEGGAAIVMQLVEGRTLHRYLHECREAVRHGGEDQPPHDLDSRLELLIKVCDAVQYAHDHGVVHRDLKPANVMLGEHGEVYVMDWGLAGVVGVPDEVIRASAGPPETNAPGDSQSGPRERASTGPGALTREGDIFGTPQYMAPEQARGETRRVGPASDQFSLGLILFELAYLKPPRVQKEGQNLMASATLGAMEPPGHFADREVPAAVQAVVAKATAREPADRYPDVKALAADLRRLLRGAPPSVVHESPLQRAWRRFNQHPVRAMRTVLGVVLMAALGISGSLWLKLRAERSATREMERLAHVSADVGERAQHIEDAMGEVEALVQGWAKAAEQALTHSDPAQPEAVEIHALRQAGKSAGLVYSTRHGQPVSFEHSSYVVAPGADAEQVRADLGRLAHLTPYLKRWLRDSSAVPVRPPALAIDADPPEHIPLLWIYIALESGLLVTYPGNVSYPEGYDPRVRPWYRDAFRGGRTRWRAPYRSVSGGEIQLPCVAALHDRSGELFGLVGMDLALSDLRERLRLERDPAWRASWLLDRDGRVLVTTALEPEAQPPADDLRSRGVDLAPFSNRRVRAQVREGTAGGALREGDTLFVLQRLRSQDWTLVVAFERDEVLLPPPG